MREEFLSIAEKKKQWSTTSGISGSDDVTKEFFSNSVFSIELTRKRKGSYFWAAYRFDSGGGRPSNNVIHRARCGRMRRRHQACQINDQARISKIFSCTSYKYLTWARDRQYFLEWSCNRDNQPIIFSCLLGLATGNFAFQKEGHVLSTLATKYSSWLLKLHPENVKIYFFRAT